jgi:hypothetical protein
VTITSVRSPRWIPPSQVYQYDFIGNRLKSADSLTLPGTDIYTPSEQASTPP